MRLKVGSQFDEFEVIKQIGVGSFSRVYLAHDTILNRQVILKILNEELSHDTREWDAFIDEAQLTASFFHPGIINVFALRVREKAHTAVQVMEYMDGGTLYDLLEEDGPLSLNLMWNLAFQAGNALQYLHDRGVIHRDVKPENVLFSRETEWFKLTDFGLSFRPHRPHLEELNSGQPGTLRYMSPEQANNEEIDALSDQYTFAAVLYEALTGEYYLPIDPEEFEDDDEDEDILIQHITSEYPERLYLPEYDTVLVEMLEDVLLKALSKNPKRRYKTVENFTQEFTRVIEYIETAP